MALSDLDDDQWGLHIKHQNPSSMFGILLDGDVVAQVETEKLFGHGVACAVEAPVRWAPSEPSAVLELGGSRDIQSSS